MSLFEDVIEFHFTLVGIHNRLTKLALLGCSKRNKGVPVIILKRIYSYCVINWGFCIGEYHRLRWLAQCIIIKLDNLIY
jgi:hypothetical protein